MTVSMPFGTSYLYEIGACVAPGNVASPGNVIIYGKCRTVAGKCRNLLKTS